MRTRDVVLALYVIPFLRKIKSLLISLKKQWLFGGQKIHRFVVSMFCVSMLHCVHCSHYRFETVSYKYNHERNIEEKNNGYVVFKYIKYPRIIWKIVSWRRGEGISASPHPLYSSAGTIYGS
jgi:hypothetical protein